MKSKSLVFKLVGLGAGAAVAGPAGAAIGSTLGGFMEPLFEDTENGGLGFGETISGVCGNLFAGELQPLLNLSQKDYNHDLRRAIARALASCLAPKGKIHDALQKSTHRRSSSDGDKEQLAALFTQWSKSITTAVNTADKKKNPAPLDKLFPQYSKDTLLVSLTEDGKGKKIRTQKHLWGAFFDHNLAEPLATSLENRDMTASAGLREDVITQLILSFPSEFAAVVKKPEHRPAWIAYQKLVLSLLRRESSGQSLKIQRRIEKLQDKVEHGLADFADFFRDASPKIDGTWKNTEEIKATLTDFKSLLGVIPLIEETHHDVKSLDSKVDKIDKAVSSVFQSTPMSKYLGNLRKRFLNHNAIGLNVQHDPNQNSSKADEITDLFVLPTCTETRYSPEEFDAAMRSGESPAVPLLDQLLKHRHVVLLGDPGMGKSTLIQWLVVSFTGSTLGKDARPFGNAIPFPIIFREIVRLLPKDTKKWNWQAIIDAYLKWKPFERGALPLASPLADDQDILRTALNSPDAWFMLDGLDEIGDPERRRILRDAIWEGFESHPHARFLVTSRWVGYDEAEVHRKVALDDFPVIKGFIETDGMKPSDAWKRIDLEGMRRGSSGFVVQGERTFIYIARLVYFSPWDDHQQREFSMNWFTLRIGEGNGPAQAEQFMQDVHTHPSTTIIGRVPNLLLLMALLYRYRAHLPHGRAKVYDAISAAYLEGIQLSTGIGDGTGRVVPYSLAQKEWFLAIIAMRMQLRRGDQTASKKGTSEILVTRTEMHEWLAGEFGDCNDPAAKKTFDEFIGYVEDRSGLLLERGEGLYGFTHLSFQEYYAAHYLEREFTRIRNADATTSDDGLFGDDEKATQSPVPLTKDDFSNFASLAEWRESVLFLMERQTDPSTVTALMSWLFKVDRQGLQAQPPRQLLPFRSAELLAALSVDPDVALKEEQRKSVWSMLWKAHIQHGERLKLQRILEEIPTPQSLQEWQLAPALLDFRETQTVVMQCLAEVATEMDVIDLSGCSSLRSIDPLADATGFCRLKIRGCYKLESLEPLRNCVGLRELDMHGCGAVTSLEPIKGLPLEDLNVSFSNLELDLELISGFSGLTFLSMQKCPSFRDTEALRPLKKLQILLLDGTDITSLGGLEELVELEFLSLGYCHSISDLEPIRNLRKLCILNLNNCSGLRSLEPLSCLDALRTLDIDESHGIISLEPLYGIKSLRTLNVIQGTSSLRGEVEKFRKARPDVNVVG